MASVEEIVSLIDEVVEDTSVPKNIRKALSDAKQRLQTDDEQVVKVSAAIYSLESVAEDVNMPPHARMQIWSIMSELESLKE
ncbi:hypothetical protein GF412_01490 [Candidatus Micrarchaeota archaeon]|nr:hypothetical protein [Candidatus Micrarchaeota archaeon]MBD3417642.1 hypothetical protein [Candidatus Micrarchaeota archaeon]